MLDGSKVKVWLAHYSRYVEACQHKGHAPYPACLACCILNRRSIYARGSSMFRQIACKDKSATLTVRSVRKSGLRSLPLLLPAQREGIELAAKVGCASGQ